MDSRTLMMEAHSHRNPSCLFKIFYSVVLLLCASSLTLTSCKQCWINEGPNQLEIEVSRSCRGSFDAIYPDVVNGRANSESVRRNNLKKCRLENVCPISNSFCFASTLNGIVFDETDTELVALDDYGVQSEDISSGQNRERSNFSCSSNFAFKFLHQDGFHEFPSNRICTSNYQQTDVSSCKRSLFSHKNRCSNFGEIVQKVKSGILDGISIPPVEIGPLLLDWGQKNIYKPSLTFLTVKNVDVSGHLSVYDPYSSNSQFYPCNFTETLLAPGETMSICFVFFPIKLGHYSAQLVVQTNFGGFLIQAKGYAVEYPYMVDPSGGLAVPSVSNPFSEVLYMEGLSAWVHLSSKNTLNLSEAICKIHALENSSECILLGAKGWFDIDNELVLINDSGSCQIEIPFVCVTNVRSEPTMDFPAEYVRVLGDFPTERRQKSIITRSLSPSKTKEMENSGADEFVLRNRKSQATELSKSVLADNEFIFPIVHVGNYCSRWISIMNPSQEPIVVQLILNSADQLIENCLKTEFFSQSSPNGILLSKQSSAPRRYGFTLAKEAIIEASINPYGSASFGPILFSPSNRCEWRDSALFRNNLSGVEWLSMKGFGGSLSLTLLEESKPIQTLEFTSNFATIPNIFSSCFQPITKEIHAKNTGDLPLEVVSIKVSGADCGLDGFRVHNCKSFSLQPGESTSFQVSYLTDFFSATTQRDLELVLKSGIFVMPMEASLPMLLFNFCKRSMFWMRVKKFMVMILYAILLFLTVALFFLRVMPLLSQDICSEREVSASVKVSEVLINDKDLILVSSSKRFDVQVKPHSGSGEKNEFQLNGDAIQDASNSSDLKSVVGKEKVRRRRKKKSSVSTLVELSSSQSGSSTPTSPLSPLPSPLPKPDKSLETKNPFAHKRVKSASKFSFLDREVSSKCWNYEPSAPAQDERKVTKKVAGSSDLFPSATCPNSVNTPSSLSCDLPYLVSKSRIPLHLRAPGSKLRAQKLVEVKSEAGLVGNRNVVEKAGVEEKFTYNMWAGSVFELRLITFESGEVSIQTSPGLGCNFESFFAPNSVLNLVMSDLKGNE